MQKKIISAQNPSKLHKKHKNTKASKAKSKGNNSFNRCYLLGISFGVVVFKMLYQKSLYGGIL